MRSKVVSFCLLAIALLAASSVHAAGSLFRSYLSIEGTDSNPCTVTAPCRLLPAALAATQSGGEVWILDSANYNTGTVTITQSVTVLAVPGALGSLLADNGDAVDVTGSGIVVTFRNMVFRELDSNSEYYGVLSSGNNTQTIIENSEFSGLAVGVVDAGTGSSNDTITQSTLRNNVQAVVIQPNSGSLGHAFIDRCTFTNNVLVGVYAISSHVVISNSSITGTGQNNSGDADGYATNADTGAVIALQNNVIEYNLVGAQLFNDQNGSIGIIETNGNNTFLFNSSDVSGGSLTSISTK